MGLQHFSSCVFRQELQRCSPSRARIARWDDVQDPGCTRISARMEHWDRPEGRSRRTARIGRSCRSARSAGTAAQCRYLRHTVQPKLPGNSPKKTNCCRSDPAWSRGRKRLAEYKCRSDVGQDRRCTDSVPACSSHRREVSADCICPHRRRNRAIPRSHCTGELETGVGFNVSFPLPLLSVRYYSRNLVKRYAAMRSKTCEPFSFRPLTLPPSVIVGTVRRQSGIVRGRNET